MWTRPRAKVLTANPKPGSMPQSRTANADPDTALDNPDYRKAKAPFAQPSDAYLYEVLYNAFRADTEFWHLWKVVDCARGSPVEDDDPLSENRGCIRVVMDLPMSEKIYPVVYTPNVVVRPLPVTNSPSSAAEVAPPPAAHEGVLAVRGIPEGASVVLEVHKLEEARRLLSWSRKCNDGEVDPSFAWLEDIIDVRDGKPEKPPARAKHKSRPSLRGSSKGKSLEPLGELSLVDREVKRTDVQSSGNYSEGLRGFSEMYADD